MDINQLVPFTRLSDALTFPITKEMIELWTKKMVTSITLRDYHSIIQQCDGQSTPSFKALVDVLNAKLTTVSTLDDDTTSKAITEFCKKGLDVNDVVEFEAGVFPLPALRSGSS